MPTKKRTKKFVKDTLMIGTGLGVGAVTMGKLGGMSPHAQPISNQAQSALSLGAVAMPIRGAKYAMDSMDMLYKKKKKKK